MASARTAALAVALLAALSAVCADPLPPITDRKILDNSVLPATTADRPPVWPYRTLNNANVAIKASGSTSRAQTWQVTVKHDPLPGLTPEMMVWFWQNLHTSVVNPADNKTYPMFLLFHPSDHAQMTGTVQNGKKITLYELALTGCTQPGSGASAPWVCQSNSSVPNPGWTKQSNDADWATTDQLNSTVRTQVSKKQAKFIFRGCNDRGQCADVTWTTHKWAVDKKSTAGMQLTSTFRVLWRATPKWSNGYTPEVRLWRMATHYVQEYGSLVNWLPQVYAARAVGK